VTICTTRGRKTDISLYFLRVLEGRMVRLRRLELPRAINPQRPQRCASTNSATAARNKGLAYNHALWCCGLAWQPPHGHLYVISAPIYQACFTAAADKNHQYGGSLPISDSRPRQSLLQFHPCQSWRHSVNPAPAIRACAAPSPS
jgi:hypothetical protein